MEKREEKFQIRRVWQGNVPANTAVVDTPDAEQFPRLEMGEPVAFALRENDPQARTDGLKQAGIVGVYMVVKEPVPEPK